MSTTVIKHLITTPQRTQRAHCINHGHSVPREDKKIYRIFWNVLDRGNETEPVLQTLLDNVTMFEINAIDLYGERHRFWPVNSDTEESFKNNLAAIEVKFTVPPHGEITRLWSVPLRMENESDPPRA